MVMLNKPQHHIKHLAFLLYPVECLAAIPLRKAGVWWFTGWGLALHLPHSSSSAGSRTKSCSTSVDEGDGWIVRQIVNKIITGRERTHTKYAEDLSITMLLHKIWRSNIGKRPLAYVCFLALHYIVLFTACLAKKHEGQLHLELWIYMEI